MFVGLFLVYPTAVVLWRSVTPGGTPGTAALERAISDPYQSSFINSINLSLASGLIGAVIGLALALAVYDLQRPRWLRPVLESWSAVASQLGGVALAFAFVTAIGTQGVVTKVLREASGSTSSTTASDRRVLGTGQRLPVLPDPAHVPHHPAGRVGTEEDVAGGGGRARRRRRPATGGRSALPLLMPSFIGGFLLLFVNAFSAYATAYVLSPSTQIVPLQIRFLLQGNVITGEQDLAYAIVTWTVLLLLAAVLVMGVANRRAALWSRQ